MPRNKDIRPVATLTVGLVAAFLSLGGLSGSAIGAQPPIPNSRGHAPLVPGDDSRAGSRLQAPTNLRGVRAQSAPTTVALPAAPTITRGPATPTTDTSATFEFGDTDPSATFLCSLDDARFRPCTSPVSYSRLSYSSHTFRVQAVNAGGTSAEASYTVQVTRPAPPPSPTIDERPQNPTTDTNATFVFHDTDPSATFRCRLDGGPYRACPSTITYTSLSYAKHTFGVQAVGSSGLTSSATTYSWRIQKPPAPPPPTIGSGPSNPTTETSATFIFEDTDTAATFQCSLDGSRFAACTSPQIYAGPLAAGNHTFRVRATGVGGTSAATSYAWRLTPVPPPAPPAPAITTQPSDPTLDTHAQFKFTDADGAATFECRLDGAPFAACKSPTNYSGLAAGFHTFQVRAVNAGGTGEPTSYTWGILPPAPLLTSTPASPAVAIEASFAFTDGDPSATFECSLDGADFASCASPQAYAALAYGSHTFQVRAVNEVGAGPVTSYSWWILPPAPEFTGWPPNPSESTSATFSFEDGDPTATFECSLDGAPFAACTSPTTYVDLASGEHTFQVRARNGGGTSAAVSYTWTVDPLKVHMRLLVISGNGGEQYDFATNPYCSPSPCKGAIQTYLDELGIPYDTMIASQTDPATLADTLGLDGTTGNYEGVILASGNLGYFDSGNNFVSGFTAEEWQTLWDYEAKFRVRQVTSVTYPGGSPDTYGLNYAGATGDTVQATLTNSGKQVFSYLNASASITIENAWTYLGTVADASVTPLLTTGDGYVIASTNTYADGRENLAVTATNAPWLLHTQLLSYGLVNWVTRGVFLGERHVSVAVQVDDLLADDDIWNVANDNDTSGDTFRMTGADFLAALSWQNGVRALDTDLQSFRIEFAFNGDGAYGDPPPQADHLGTAYPPDTLSPAVVANQGNFSFVNHTYTHQNLDSTDYATSLTEIANDQTAAGLLGLSNYSDEPFIQPDISGLSNPAFWQAAWDSGIRYLISDTSRPGGGNPSPNAGFHVGDTGQQLLVVPRHPSNLFYNLQTPAQWVDEYNWYYWLGSPSDSAWKFWPEPQTYSQILDHESDVLLGYMLAWDIDPWMFHQPNLGLYDGSHSLLGDLLDQTFQKYLAVYNLPVLGPAMKDLGETMADRMAFDASGVSGTLVPCQSLTLSVAKTAAIPVTGVTAGTTETYGGQPISTISVTAGSPVTIPATCGS